MIFFNSTGSDGSGSDSWSEDEDPSFSEKPKIKREASERSSRARKRPSFFQEYENEEDNLDKILDEFEQEQVIFWPFSNFLSKKSISSFILQDSRNHLSRSFIHNSLEIISNIVLHK